MEVLITQSKENRCRGVVTCHNKSAKLICKLSECPVSGLSEGVRIGVHPNDPKYNVEICEIKNSVILELPDVCPALEDYNSRSEKYRLPEGLK